MASFAGKLLGARGLAAAAAAGAGAVAGAAWLWPGQGGVHARNWHSDTHLKYPASANYPDLSWHNNRVKDHLTPAVSPCCLSNPLSTFLMLPIATKSLNITEHADTSHPTTTQPMHVAGQSESLIQAGFSP